VLFLLFGSIVWLVLFLVFGVTGWLALLGGWARCW
jgi:hypothetical protein